MKILAACEFKNWANKYKDMDQNEILAYESMM